jgi:hypothetical protein
MFPRPMMLMLRRKWSRLGQVDAVHQSEHGLIAVRNPSDDVAARAT